MKNLKNELRKVSKFTFLFLLLVFGFVSCQSTELESAEISSRAKKTQGERKLSDSISLKKYSDIMFWELKGLDKNNEEASVYILGTIHFADSRLYPIPQVITDAWNNSDRLVGEISSEDWLLFESVLQQKITNAFDASGNNLLSDKLTVEEIQQLVSYFGEELTAQLLFFDPWVINSSLSSVTFEFSDLEAMQSYDMYFIGLSANEQRVMEGLDTLALQLDLLSFGDWDFQYNQLKENLKVLKNPEPLIKETQELYQAYLSGDEDILANYLLASEDDDIKENAAYKDYYEAMFTDRNKDWAELIKEYLHNGGKTFIFAGAGHFVGNDSVFSFLE